MAILLITGVSGYVGQAVAPLAVAAGHRVTGTFLSHPLHIRGCDLRRVAIDQIPALIQSLRPDVVLHTAAAWRTEEEARAVIVAGTRRIALACAETGARLIHISTDLVFDGEHAPYVESDPPAPVNFYGAAKVEAERIVAEVCGLGHPSTPFHSAQDARARVSYSAQDALAATIVRTSLVTCFDPPDPRTQPILDALHGRRAPVALFTDEYRCPVRVEDLAAALVELSALPFAGILHLAGPERLSRYELGLRIAAYHRLDPAAGIIPMLTAASGMLRPRDCTLSIAFARRVLHTNLQPLP